MRTLFVLVCVFYCVSGLEPRIVGGKVSREGSHPHQISLRKIQGQLSYHTCGGSLLSDEWVLTAAHCVEGSTASSMRVRVGEHLLDTQDKNEAEYLVGKVIVHENYNDRTGTYANDIALLKLATKVTLGTGVSPISLASSGDFAGKRCTISGWGRVDMADGSLTNTNVLMEADMTVLNTADCAVMWSDVNANIINSHICIYADNTAACNGDSGGPLVCSGALAGVTSWGISGCGTTTTKFYPSVYTRVTSFKSWIEEKMATN